MLVFHFFIFLTFPPAFLILFISVDPNPLTPYVGCYVTQVDPIIFISWILLLFYDTGAIVIYHATWSSFAEGSCVSDVYIDGHSSVKSLWAFSNPDASS